MFRSGFWGGFGLVLLGYAWLSSNHFRPWINFQAEMLAFLGVGCVAAAGLRRGVLQIWPLPALCVAAATLLPVAQYLTDVLPFAGDLWLALTYLTALSTAIALGYGWGIRAPGGDAVVPWSVVLLLPAVLSAVIGVLQWAQLSEVTGIYGLHVDVGDRPMGNMGQPNQLATLLLMGLCAWLVAGERLRVGPAGQVAVVGLLTVVLAFSQSRSALLGGSAAALFLAAKLHRGTQAGRLRRWHVLTWLATYWALSMLAPAINDALLAGGNRGIGLTDSNSRDRMWLQMLYAIGQSPWWGYGWNQSPVAHRVGALAFPGELSLSHAHSIALDLMAWAGVPLGLLLFAACVYWIVDRLARVRHWHGVIAMAALLPFALHSLLEFPFAYAYFLLPAGLLVGRIEASAAERSRGWAPPRRLVAAALAGSAVVGAVMVSDYFDVEADFRVVRFEAMRVGRVPADHVPARVHLLTQLGAMLDAARLRPRPAMPPEDLALLRQAAVRFPYGAIGFRYAIALALNGDPEGAAREFAIMRGMYGEGYYLVIVREMRQLQADTYPQLAAVRT